VVLLWCRVYQVLGTMNIPTPPPVEVQKRVISVSVFASYISFTSVFVISYILGLPTYNSSSGLNNVEVSFLY
jgi:hypothetical protein